MVAGLSDTRQLDSVLRSVDQAQVGLSTVFEALPTLERRSLIYTPMQLRQVPPPLSPTTPPAHPSWVNSPPSSLIYLPVQICQVILSRLDVNSGTSKVRRFDVHCLSCACHFSVVCQCANHSSHMQACCTIIWKVKHLVVDSFVSMLILPVQKVQLLC